MSNLSPADKQYLENALRLDTGFVLNFSDKTFSEFFQYFNIDIDDVKYRINGDSKAKRFRTFCQLESNELVGRVVLEIAGLLRNVELRGHMNVKFSVEIEKIGRKLMEKPDLITSSVRKKSINQKIKIQLCPAIYQHVKRYLETEDYFHAVEEAYKLVREKLTNLTGTEKANEAFAEGNYELIFGHKPKDAQEKDFFSGIKFLHMALQYFRNEKVHTPAEDLDENRAMQYLTLANLAYILISEDKE